MKKITVSQLKEFIRESVHIAMEDFDRGDIALHQSAQTDQLVKNTDQLLDILRGIIKNAARKEQGQELVKNINSSLNGFVTKVSAASKTLR